jgi:hypothetical protein
MTRQWNVVIAVGVAMAGFGFIGTPVLASDARRDPLWLKALEVARTNAHWVPGLVITRSEVLAAGETKVHELWERSSLGSHGQVVTTTVKVIEDGKDVTAKETKKDQKIAKPGKQGAGKPFDLEVQNRLLLVVTNQTRTVAGTDCVGYWFEVRNTNGPSTRGVVWVQKETGIPVEIENMRLDPLPDKRLKQMAITTEYQVTTNGWHVKEMRTVGHMKVLFINAEFHSTTTFSEYWRKPAAGGLGPESRTPSSSGAEK